MRCFEPRVRIIYTSTRLPAQRVRLSVRSDAIHYDQPLKPVKHQRAASDVGPVIADQVASTNAQGSGKIIRVVERASLQRETAATNAGRKIIPKTYEGCDLII